MLAYVTSLETRAIFAALFCFFAMAVPAHAQKETTSPLTITSKSGLHRFQVEVADTDDKRARGLMFRRSMPADHGMLFLFGREQMIDMWMRNTYLPLDMIFIGADGVIRHIAVDSEPFSEAMISSLHPASAVLEVNAGVTRKLGIVPGDRIEHAKFPASK